MSRAGRRKGPDRRNCQAVKVDGRGKWLGGGNGQAEETARRKKRATKETTGGGSGQVEEIAGQKKRPSGRNRQMEKTAGGESGRKESNLDSGLVGARATRWCGALPAPRHRA